MIDVEIAKTLSGWMADAELEWLAGQAETHERIIEIGSLAGRSTRALAAHTAGKVFAVDLWGDYVRPVPSMGEPIPERMTAEENFRLFKKNMGGFLFNKVIPIMANHRDLEWLTINPDMVFLDGDHRYEGIRRDIETWRKLIVDGGLLCGHDAAPYWPDVSRAVQDVLGIVQVVPDTTIWYYIAGNQ